MYGLFRNVLLLSVFVLFSIPTRAQLDFGEAKLEPRYQLGLLLTPTGSGELYHFAVIENLGNDKYEYQQISRFEFLAIAFGQMDSPANPEHKNLIKEFQVDTLNEYWDPLANLWRLRYSGHPFDPDDNSGWFLPNPDYMFTAKEIRNNPSLKFRVDSMRVIYNKQQAVLKGLGIERFSQYIKGDKIFTLLKYMQNIDWIQSYVQAPLPSDVVIPLTQNKPAPIPENVRTNPAVDKRRLMHEGQLTIQSVSRSGWDQLTNGPKKKNN